MALDPYFFQAPADFAEEPEDSDLYFRILGYSQYQNYTLVVWGYGDTEEYVAGQSLYRDRELLATSGGALLYSESSDRGKAGEPNYQQLMGQLKQENYGLPQHAIEGLLDRSNYHDFTGGIA